MDAAGVSEGHGHLRLVDFAKIPTEQSSFDEQVREVRNQPKGEPKRSNLRGTPQKRVNNVVEVNHSNPTNQPDSGCLRSLHRACATTRHWTLRNAPPGHHADTASHWFGQFGSSTRHVTIISNCLDPKPITAMKASAGLLGSNPKLWRAVVLTAFQ